MDPQVLIEHGETIGYAVVGAITLIGFLIIHLFRRRADRKQAMTAVRLASLSLNDPRTGPVAIRGTYRRDTLECNGQQVALDGAIEIVRGSKARWVRSSREYTLRDGETVIAIGVMSKKGAGWSLAASPGEPGVLLYAEKPVAAPPPLFPFRAFLFLGITGAIGFFGLYGIGNFLLDVPKGSDIDPCREAAITRFEFATAVPQFGVRDQALEELAKCAKSAPQPAPH